MTALPTKEEWAELRRLSTDTVLDLVQQHGERRALLGYQQRTIALLETAGCRVLFIEKSRRIGLTWGFASYAVLRAGRAKKAGGMDVMYISYSQEMTREFIDACAMWARAFSSAAFEMEEFLFDDGDDEGQRSIQAFRIRFASGFEVIGLSSAPRSLRGKQGVVMIDEAAFVDNLKELLKAALAFLMWGGQVVVCSTHNGTENEFNLQIQDILGGRSNYKHLRIDFDQALQEGLYERICLVTGKEWTPEAEAEWRQEIIKFYGDGADEELFCVPTMGNGAWLTGPLIEARMTSDAPVLILELPADYLQLDKLKQQALMAPFLEQLDEALAKLHPLHLHAFGFDFARVSDLSVATLLAVTLDMQRKSAVTVEMRNVPGDEQKLVTRTILKSAKRLVGAAFDATGMGWTVAEDMGREFGLRTTETPAGLIEAIKFTSNSDWYRTEMPPLKVAFEDGAISISKNAEHMSDLRLVKIIQGIPRIPNVRTGGESKKRHGDYAVALALAYYASRMQWTEFSYTPVPPAASKFDTPNTDRDDGAPYRLATMRRSRGLY